MLTAGDWQKFMNNRCSISADLTNEEINWFKWSPDEELIHVPSWFYILQFFELYILYIKKHSIIKFLALKVHFFQQDCQEHGESPE